MLDLSKFLQCTVCRELKSNPRETQCCHKLYCQDCMKNITDICPTCRQRTSFIENPLVSQFINNKLGDDIMTGNYPSPSPSPSPSPFGFWINSYFSRNDSDTNNKAFRITVLTLEDRKINIYVEPSDTIKILKLKVKQKDGIAPEYQRLIFQGKQLEDHNTISDYNIRNDNTIHLVNRFNSG
ncbi:hypothetical protein RclHR1_06380005 [Rhizophagus clarus]|uniref:Ubiquitin-like domain-containing protein n=1 Tax=Rhizophagus clarus TaxID=94130 RepID=A0A2Z6RSJ5_9GLOM|nr:hypothetical protein RclHR1_06380005 [Rhizophagus clarus]